MTDSDAYRILIFEDKQDHFEDLREPLEELIADSPFELKWYDGTEMEGEREASDLVAETLMEPSPPALVIMDWELNEYDNGVRRAHVKVGCEETGVPLCFYHRDPGGRFATAEKFKRWEEDAIKIDPKEDPSEVADVCAGLARGFVRIREALEQQTKEPESPSAIAKVLGAPAAAESQLDQYSWGSSEGITLARDESPADRVRFASTFLGYWIYNQLLQFPGVLLNRVALASYLGVDHTAFVSDSSLREPFEDALYDGPFAELGEWWWTALIDEIRGRHGEPDDDGLVSGPELFDRIGGLEIDEVECVQGHPGAGYYCILTGNPVCKDHSVRAKGWIPIGASQARISEDEYSKVAAWMPD